ncbi:12449_t:CDS:2 [Ambispora gerdemannii]|uniref:Mitochondrial import inner membrane translocase subunit n=1 Tax=Ambispora gerdemannii TaxID=144530 RepID=A0A9N9GSB1_9GLOM|nr:12449_t:CDS:2 [Ambispora gerdemannii]
MDFSTFNDAERAHIQRLIEQKQMRDFMKFYTGLVERCFNDCVNDFTSKALTTKEETCVLRCTEKFIKYNERISLRFGELNQELMQQQAATAAQQQPGANP